MEISRASTIFGYREWAKGRNFSRTFLLFTQIACSAKSMSKFWNLSFLHFIVRSKVARLCPSDFSFWLISIRRLYTPLLKR